MEAIITVVGFLGAGKTTLLNQLTNRYLELNWQPFIILNDYENADLDTQQFLTKIDRKAIKSLTGSCICCSGIDTLRDSVNRVPERKNGITLIEANGTSDACALMSFLGVGVEKRFLPPVQISVVDAKNWQRRGEHNELEANQIQVSSLIVLTHTEHVTSARIQAVTESVKKINPQAEIIDATEVDAALLPKLSPVNNKADKLPHLKAHWSSCSTDLPKVPNEACIKNICEALPKGMLRIKGCTQIAEEENYTYFERTPDGEIFIRPFNGVPTTGPKILTIGPGSRPELLAKVIAESLGKISIEK